jgi:ElaB/YqjD/DUF883 family membrane-anchored ribosome-binding protein
MNKKIISILCSLFYLFYSFDALGVEDKKLTLEKDKKKGKFSFLFKGQIADYDGVLFDERAVAVILADKDFQEQNGNLRLLQQKDKLELKHKQELELKLSEIKNQKEECKEIVEVKNKQIVEIEKIAIQEKTDWTATIIGTSIGLVVGIVGGIYIYGKINE